MRLSARTMRVRVAFSMAKRVLPSCPAMRPMARLRWSPCSVLTSLTYRQRKCRYRQLQCKATASNACRLNFGSPQTYQCTDLQAGAGLQRLGPRSRACRPAQSPPPSGSPLGLQCVHWVGVESPNRRKKKVRHHDNMRGNKYGCSLLRSIVCATELAGIRCCWVWISR